MKKILPVLLAFLFLLTLPVFAASGRLTATAASSGDKVTVTVRLDNPGIVAARIFVRYDSQVLQLTNAQNGEVFPAADSTFGKDLSADPYTMLWLQADRRDNNTTSGTLCTLTFAVKGDTESSQTSVRFSVDKASTFDVDLNEVTIADGSCSVDVPAAATKAPVTTSATTAKTPIASPTTTTTTTKAQPTTTTKAPVTTTKITASSGGEATTLKMPDKIASAVSAAASSAAESVKVKTSEAAANAASTAAQGEDTKPATTAANGTAEAALGETVPDLLTTDGTLPTAPETLVEPQIEPAPPANHRGLLWLLLLIPAAVAVILVVRKKKQ